MALPVIVIVDKYFNFLWGNAGRKVSYVYYDVKKKSNNPYLVENTCLTMYMPDKNICYNACIGSDEDRDDVAYLLKTMTSRNDVYFVTYDGAGHKSVYLKSLVPPLETDDIRTIDIKKLFYLTHPTVPDTTYGKIMSRYQLLSGSSSPGRGSEKNIEFSYMFHKIMKDDWYADKVFDAKSIHNLYRSLSA